MPRITALCLEASRIAFEGWLTWQGRGSINECRVPSVPESDGPCLRFLRGTRVEARRDRLVLAGVF